MFHIIEFYQERKSLIFFQITKSFLTCHGEFSPKCSYAGSQKWNFILAHIYTPTYQLISTCKDSAFFVILQTFVRKSMPYVFLVVEQIDKNSSYKLHLKLIAAVALPARRALPTA